jgi:hypothetical protein
VTRLALGIAANSLEGLIRRTQRWEQQTRRAETAETGAQAGAQPPVERRARLELSDAQYALIGLGFDLQERAARGVETLRQAGRLAGRATAPFFRLAARAPWMGAARERLERLAARGQDQVDYWEALGRQEEAFSRRLARTATTSTIDRSIDYLTTNPEVQELVEIQSTSLINEFIDEARERAFSADVLIEALVRNALRLPPRDALPGPAPEVRLLAARIRRRHR